MAGVYAVMPVRNRKATTLQCLSQLRDLGCEELLAGIVVVDDGSSDGTRAAVETAFPAVKVVTGDGTLWWTGGVNLGSRAAMEEGAEAVVLLNDDLELEPHFLEELLSARGRLGDALYGSAVSFGAGDAGRSSVLWGGYRRTGPLKRLERAKVTGRGEAGEVLEFEALAGACLLVPRIVFETCGYFDARRYPHHYGDFEFTLRAWAQGFKCRVVKGSVVRMSPNKNYSLPYLLQSARRDFVRNAFASRRHPHSFANLWRLSLVGKGRLVGLCDFLRRSLGAVAKIAAKLCLPSALLQRLYGPRAPQPRGMAALSAEP